MDQEDNIKKEYELAFLVNEETDAPGIIEALKAAGASITQEGPVRKVALAYEIKKQASANFGFVQFSMDPAAAKPLEAAMNLRAEVLRFMLITPPSAKEKPYPQASATTTPVRPSAKPFEPKTAPALSNEALEKKIEEILQ